MPTFVVRYLENQSISRNIWQKKIVRYLPRGFQTSVRLLKKACAPWLEYRKNKQIKAKTKGKGGEEMTECYSYNI